MLTKRSKLIVLLLLMVATHNAIAAIAIHPRPRTEIQAVLDKALPSQADLRQLNIVLVAGKKDHKLYEHEYPLWQNKWRSLLASAPDVNVSTAQDFPDPNQLRSADLIVIFFHGGKSSSKWDAPKIKQIKDYLARGGGLVALHSAAVTHDNLSQPLAEILGLVWEYGYTKFRHGPMELQITDPNHPICLSLPKTIHLFDEAYWQLRGDYSKVNTLATSNETIDTDPDKTNPEPIIWTYQPGPGRVFASTIGHYIWTLDDPYFRILTLRGFAWAAGENTYRFDSLVLTDSNPIENSNDIPAFKAGPKTIEDAIANYTAMLSLPKTTDQQKAQIHADLGRLFFKDRNDIQSLLTETNKVLACDPENHILLYNIGIAKLFLAKPDRALNLCLPAIQKFSIDQADENLQLLMSKSWKLPKSSNLAYDKIIHNLNLRKRQLQ